MRTSTAVGVGNRTIGSVAIDGDAIRGEGGSYDARLVLPLEVTLQPQPPEATLALTALACSLHLDQAANDPTQFGAPVTVDLWHCLPCRSYPSNSLPTRVEVRLRLSPTMVARIEERRHGFPEKSFVGWLRIVPTVAWLYRTGYPSPAIPGIEQQGAIDPNPWATAMVWSHVPAILTDAGANPLRIEVPPAAWVERVLPGLGTDDARLVCATFVISPGLLGEKALSAFEEARKEFDAGRYRECIQKCRDVRHAVEKQLKATEKNQIDVAVAALLGWGPESPQRKFVSNTWKGLVDLTSASHHSGGPAGYSMADARSCLMLTAMLLDYLGRVLAPAGFGTAAL